MPSSILTQGVARAFSALKGLGITQVITFTLASNRSYGLATGEVTETEQTVTLDGVIDEILKDGGGNVLEVPVANIIIDKASLNGIDYSRFDSCTTNGTTYNIIDWTDSQYHLEMKGRKA